MDFDTKLEISKQRSYSVVKSNEIIQKARYDLTISELKTAKQIRKYGGSRVLIVYGGGSVVRSGLLDRVCENLKKEQLILDLGIGFGKTPSQNLQILQNIEHFHKYGFKILIGHSRKSFMKVFSNASTLERDVETLAISMKIANKVDILRVHTPLEHKRALLAVDHVNNQFV